MKLKAFYHVLMINNWESIFREQLDIMTRSGLYEALDSISIGALGEDVKPLQTLIKDYPKCEILRYSNNTYRYEFWTLEIAHYMVQTEKPFYGLYFHSKAVSFPTIEGGKYWRDYMNEYNLKKWPDNVKMLRKGFDTCGVKLMDETIRPFKTHYSGNFFWFKSSYMKTLPDPKTLDQRNRYEAEFWIGMSKPKAATLCQDFVDYNTKGSFSGVNYVHTLCWNLPSEVEKVTAKLYEQNENFTHLIVDLGFPIVEGDKIPGNIESAKKENTAKLKAIAKKYGSKYVRMQNIGVSQNWEQVFKFLNMADNDVLIGADPDEHPLNNGWVAAMGNVLRSGYALAALMMTDHEGLLAGRTRIQADGINILKSPAGINWALIGMTGKFIKQMGGVPYPANAERYGWIEAMIRQHLDRLKLDYAVLTDYKVRHTDYELNDPGTSKLLREWKNLIIFEIRKYGQISFEEFLIRKRKGEL